MIFVAGAHEEVLQLPANGLLLPLDADPVTRHRCGEPMVAVVVAEVVTLVVIRVLSAAVCGAISSHRVDQASSFKKEKLRFS